MSVADHEIEEDDGALCELHGRPYPCRICWAESVADREKDES